MERAKSNFSFQVPFYLLANVPNSCSSSVTNREMVSLAGEREAEPSVTGPVWLGRGRPKNSHWQWLCFPLASNQGQLWREQHASKWSSWSQVSTGMVQ